MAGKHLVSEEIEFTNGFYEQEFDLSEHPKGTYVVQCYQKGNALTEQVVIR